MQNEIFVDHYVTVKGSHFTQYIRPSQTVAYDIFLHFTKCRPDI